MLNQHIKRLFDILDRIVTALDRIVTASEAQVPVEVDHLARAAEMTDNLKEYK